MKAIVLLFLISFCFSLNAQTAGTFNSNGPLPALEAINSGVGQPDLRLSGNGILTAGGDLRIYLNDNGPPVGNKFAIFSGDSTEVFNIFESGTASISGSLFACVFSTCSDLRYKKDIQELGTVLDKISKLNAVYYNWDRDKFSEKNFSDRLQIGVIAQEVENIFPELVLTNPEGYKTVAYDRIGPILIEGLKELIQENQVLRKEQEKLNQKITWVESLEKRIFKLEEMLEKN